MDDMSKTINKLLGAACALAFCAGAWAQSAAPVTVLAPWARASVPGQKASGAFMTLVASEPVTLVGASSPAAGFAEVHEMTMEGDVMRMRPLTAGLALKPGQPVQLKPGGYHLMLQDLKAPLAAGSRIALTLSFRTAAGETRQLALQVPVSALPPREAGAAGAHGHRKH